MCEGYGSHFVYVSVTKLGATYLVYTLKTRYYLAFYKVFHCVDFFENVFFFSKSSGNINCLIP